MQSKMHSLRLLWAAHNENAWERRQNRLRQRRQLETIEDMPELLFIQHFRLNKRTFRKLCYDLKCHAGLKGSPEIPLEIKVKNLTFINQFIYLINAGIIEPNRN